MKDYIGRPVFRLPQHGRVGRQRAVQDASGRYEGETEAKIGVVVGERAQEIVIDRVPPAQRCDHTVAKPKLVGQIEQRVLVGQRVPKRRSGRRFADREIQDIGLGLGEDRLLLVDHALRFRQGVPVVLRQHACLTIYSNRGAAVRRCTAR